MYLGSPMLGMYTHTHTHTYAYLQVLYLFSWIDNFIIMEYPSLGFPGGTLVKKNPPANAGDMGSIPGLEKSPGVGKGNPL